jgi:hypothetical protein
VSLPSAMSRLIVDTETPAFRAHSSMVNSSVTYPSYLLSLCESQSLRAVEPSFLCAPRDMALQPLAAQVAHRAVCEAAVRA